MALALPRPDNLRGSWGTLVDTDVYGISERVKEIDPNLYIYRTEQPGGAVYSIGEMCVDGVERLVFRTHQQLDARVIEKLQYLLHVPFEQRYAAAERAEAQLEAERKERELDQLYEDVGGPMRSMLYRCGFSDAPASYPKQRKPV